MEKVTRLYFKNLFSTTTSEKNEALTLPLNFNINWLILRKFTAILTVEWRKLAKEATLLLLGSLYLEPRSQIITVVPKGECMT